MRPPVLCVFPLQREQEAIWYPERHKDSNEQHVHREKANPKVGIYMTALFGTRCTVLTIQMQMSRVRARVRTRARCQIGFGFLDTMLLDCVDTTNNCTG